MRLLIFFLLFSILMSCDSNVLVQEKQSLNCEIDTLSVVRAYNESQKEDSSHLEIAPNETMVLPGSHKTGRFNEISPFFLRSVEKSDCGNSSGYPNPNSTDHIKQVDLTDSTLVITCSLIETCASDFLCEAEIIKGNCLNLIYHQYNSNADCRCILSLKYNFRIHSFHEPELYEELNLDKIEYVTINGKSKFSLK